MTEKKLKKGEKDQLKRFQEAAKALGCSEDEGAFDKALKKVASAAVKPTQAATKR